MVTFGFNIDTGSISFELAIEAMKQSGASHHLLMIAPNSFYLGTGDLDTIRKYLSALPSHVKLIIRVYNANEGNWQRYPAAIEYERHWRWIRANLGDSLTSRLVFDDPVNEPNLGGNDANLAKPYVARCVSMVKAASNAGIKFAVGAWSVGTPHESLFDTVYTPLWWALHEHKQAISLHAYGAIPNEAGELAPLEIVLNAAKARDYLSQDRWPMDYQGWLMARPYRIISHFEKYELGLPEIYITECFVDNVFNSQSSWIKEAWKAKYSSPQYPDPRGVQAWERYLKEMFPEKAFDESIAYLLAHARRNIFYHEAFKGACLFALNAQWGYPNGSNKEAGSNYADGQFSRFRAELLPKLNAETYEDIPLPSFPLFPAKVSSKSTSNIRSVASATAPILQVLTNAWIEARIAREGTFADGYTWLEIQIGETRGFVAKTSNLVIEELVETPTERMFFVDIPGGATKEMKQSSLDDLIEYHRLALEGLRIIRNAPPVE